MSKLYKHYVLLKINNPNRIYLFKCGIFYIFIHDDAILMSKLLNLKLTDLNYVIKKCGFPVNSSNKYFNILKTLDYEIEIVSSDDFSSSELNTYMTTKKYEDIVKDFLELNIDELSISQAFDCLHEFQKRVSEVESKNFSAGNQDQTL